MKKQRSVHVSNCTRTEETNKASTLKFTYLPQQKCSLCLRADVEVSSLRFQLCHQQKMLLAKSCRQLVDFDLWLAKLCSRRSQEGSSVWWFTCIFGMGSGVLRFTVGGCYTMWSISFFGSTTLAPHVTVFLCSSTTTNSTLASITSPVFKRV